MSSLSLTEAMFQDYVLGTDARIVGEVAGADDDFRKVRLDIYRAAYRLRLVEVLGSDYAVLKSHCGDTFEAIAEEYLAAHPSTHRNVRWFGAGMAMFLRQHPRHGGQPLLADLAAFEWALGLAFDAADLAAVTFDQVAGVAPEQWPELRFAAHPSLQVLTLRTAAIAVWNAANSGESGEAPQENSAVDWAIWRKGHSPHFRSLETDEAWALAALREDCPFGEICAGLCDWVAEADAAPSAAQLLRGWVEEGWIASLRTS